jgi:hypothetical protein
VYKTICLNKRCKASGEMIRMNKIILELVELQIARNIGEIILCAVFNVTPEDLIPLNEQFEADSRGWGINAE